MLPLERLIAQIQRDESLGRSTGPIPRDSCMDASSYPCPLPPPYSGPEIVLHYSVSRDPHTGEALYHLQKD